MKNKGLYLLLIFGLVIYIALGPLQEGVNPEYLPRTVQIIGAGLIGLVLIQLLNSIELRDKQNTENRGNSNV